MLTPSTCSPDTLLLWNSLPGFVTDLDAQNGYLFLTWLDASASQLQVYDDLCRDSGNVPGWSALLDVSRCPSYALPWLAQFVGTRLDATQTVANQRAQIMNPPGWGRGTAQTIQQAVSNYLLPGYSAFIVERTALDKAGNAYADAYSLLVQVPTIGLNGGTYARLDSEYKAYSAMDAAYTAYSQMTSSSSVTAQVTAAVKAAVPAGVNVTVNFV